jgi:Protein of Unknown function (DUF2784)
MLVLLDIIFTWIHLVVILFNSLGWIWPSMRKAHLVTILLTAISWFVLGIWYGWGYCFLTDWQWAIKAKLGETGLPASFIKYAADKVTGSDINGQLVDTITLTVFLGSILMSVYVNFFLHNQKGS